VQAAELIRTISLPEQNRKKLSFCASNKTQRVIDWANLLRPTQIEKTGTQLYSALPEINALLTSADARLDMLEHLRPFVQHSLNGLSKHYLHVPLSLTHDAQKSAIISQALQKQMVDGYILCARDLLANKKLKPGDPKLALCLHRAMTGLGLLFLRTYQIYAQVPKGLWHSLHTLFRIADLNELLDSKLSDEAQKTTKLSSIQEVYLKTILMASARTHQLNQNDISALYEAFGEWSKFIRFDLDLSDDPDKFYCVDLASDDGPVYKTRLNVETGDSLIIELDLSALLSQLTKQRGEHKINNEAVEDIGAPSIELPKDITPAILEHILEAWGNISQRKQERRQMQATADLCVGLSACHYYISGGQDFSDFLRSTGSGSGELENALSRGFTPADQFSDGLDDQERPINRVEIQNVSQGGYCISWNSNHPIKVESGSVIGVREFGKRVWAIGVVRWIRQKKNSSQMGIQLISDRAQPYAIAQAYDIGGYSDYMRALYLPQTQFSDYPPSLLVSTAPLQSSDKVRIQDGDNEYAGKLDDKLFGTTSVQRFSFHDLEGRIKQTKSQSSFSEW